MHSMCLILVVANVCVVCLFCKNQYLWSDAVQLHMIFLCLSLCCLFCIMAIEPVRDNRRWLWLTCPIWWISPLDHTSQSCGDGTTTGRLTGIYIVVLSPSAWCEHISDLGDGSPWLCRPFWHWIWAKVILLFDPLHLHLLERRRTWWM